MFFFIFFCRFEYLISIAAELCECLDAYHDDTYCRKETTMEHVRKRKHTESGFLHRIYFFTTQILCKRDTDATTKFKFKKVSIKLPMPFEFIFLWNLKDTVLFSNENCCVPWRRYKCRTNVRWVREKVVSINSKRALTCTRGLPVWTICLETMTD